MNRKLLAVYKRLLREFGPQGWWPAETPFEVIVGAILTQSTSWQNVEKAIQNLKKAGLLSPDGLRKVPLRNLAVLIRPALYYNVKARKLKRFMDFLYGNYDGNLDLLLSRPAGQLREELLSVWGVGPETADSIVLYAAHKPSFVIDAYTKRIYWRLGMLSEDVSYDEAKRFFEDGLPKDVLLYQEYHALIVELGKRYCRTKPVCVECCLKNYCRFG
ncbi:MAG: endonuclease III domain-containing protein [Candidatus Altiarchaeota archaeon]|nr:endonuclease III domain-containing protein [Candidatus Altiarchaeota archaeon]